MRGVYFLANDAVMELAVAFLNSFRTHNMTTALCLIPFDRNCTKITRLGPKYRFEVFEDAETLAICDETSRRFHNRVEGQYRKLATWNGPFDEFAYIDADSVLVRPLDFVFRLLDEFGVLTAHSNTLESRKYVWRDSIAGSKELSVDQTAFAANTGFFASSKKTSLWSGVQQKAESALRLKGHMALNCHEQSFLNYLIVTSGTQYDSLLNLWRRDGRRDIALEHWAGWRRLSIGNRILARGTPWFAKVFLFHWAGLRPDLSISLRNWIIGDQRRSLRGLMSIGSVPCAGLWWRYRLKCEEGD